MIRRIIQIDKELCNGCGACADACHEGAIGMADGKAQLLRDDYCDGLGDCLPNCPTGAITFVEREAAAYDEAAVKAAQAKKAEKLPCGCPGSNVQEIRREPAGPHHAPAHPDPAHPDPAHPGMPQPHPAPGPVPSQLSQWPVQLKLVPANAPFFNGAKLLIAADCTAYAYGNFHDRFIKNRVTVIGCPKLDSIDYTEKLTQIIRDNDIESVTIVRMEVPCCGGIANAAKAALQASGKFIPWQVVVISSDGRIISE